MKAQRLLIVAAFAAGALLLRPLWFAAAPGLLFLLWPRARRTSPAEELALALGGSTAFWVVAFWFLDLTGLPCAPAAWTVSALTLAGGLVLALRPEAGQRARLRPAEALVTALLLLTVLARLAPAWTQLAAPGADMSMHSYLAELIVEEEGIPDSFEPILPFSGVAAYAPGFHCLMALARDPGGAGPLAAGLWAAGWVFALFGLALFLFLRRFAPGLPALAAMVLISFGAPHPQDMFATGTVPAVLGLSAALLAAALLLRAREGLGSCEVLTAGLFLAAVPLSHAIPAVILLYAALPACGFALAQLRRGERSMFLWNAVLFGLSALAFLLPYLMQLHTDTSAAEQRWSRSWQEALWPGGVLGLPAFLWRYGGVALAACAAAAGWLAWRRARRAILPAGLCLLLGLLLLNAKAWVLPLSSALYPDRVAQAFLAPAGAFFAIAIDRLAAGTGGMDGLDGPRERLRRLVAPAALAAAAVLGAFVSWQHYYAPGRAQQAVTAADQEAFAWIREHVPRHALILNNYDDAGLWIPALTLRRAVVIHTTPFFLDEIRAFQEAAEPDHVYVGARTPEGRKRAFERSRFDAQPDDFEVLYDRGGAVLYRARDPAALRAWFQTLPAVQRFRERYEAWTAPRD